MKRVRVFLRGDSDSQAVFHKKYLSDDITLGMTNGFEKSNDQQWREKLDSYKYAKLFILKQAF